MTSRARAGALAGGASQELLDERAIRRQLCHHGRAIDRLDMELWRSVWHDDGTVDDPELGLRGRASELSDDVQVVLAAWAVHSHQITTTLIEVDGDHAVSETYATNVLRRRSDAAGRSVDDHRRTRYLDRWSRRDGRWAIDHRHAVPMVAWQQEAGDGYIGRWSRRDRRDLSYELLASLGGEPDEDVAALVAEREIRAQHHRYCRAIDRFDPGLWESVWHPDATMDYRDVDLEGPIAGQAELMTCGHRPWATHTHQSTSAIVLVRGDEAVSETYGTSVLFARPDEEGRLIDTHYRGRYLDRWSRRDGRWAIDHRRTVSDLRWTEVSGGEVGTRARRDRDDPSFAEFARVKQSSG